MREERRPLAAGLVVLAASTLAGVYFATQLYLAYPEPYRRPFGEALVINLVFYWLWALATPAVVALGARFRFEGGRWAQSLAVHAAAGLGLASAQIVLATLALAALGLKGAEAATAGGLATSLRVNLHSSAPTYLMILAAYFGVDYYRKFRERELRASRLQAELAGAQLDALRAQLNPHFLFNALNSISSLMYDEPEAADEMIAKLGSLLRLALEKGKAHEIALRDELELVGRYLEIEQIRFEERLSVAIDVAPDALPALVPAFSLQPLVENAIRHAIAPRVGGRVELSARREGGALRIELCDDGPGLPESGPREGGVGLANTRARLARLYGPSHRFAIGGRPGGGLAIAIDLPYRREAAGAPP